MPTWCFAAPVLPGKLELITVDVPLYLRANMAEYELSRRRASMSMERVFVMPGSPDVLTIYGEGEFDFEKTMGTIAESQLDLDQFLLDMWSDAVGMDLRSGPWPHPELVWNYEDENASRFRGLAFAVPIPPGKREPLVRFFEEAMRRLSEIEESRRAIEVTRDQGWLLRTPAGDLCCIYFEAPDPVAANAAFAASNRPIDVWFKKEAGKAFGMDLGGPLPAIRRIWEWPAFS